MCSALLYTWTDRPRWGAGVAIALLCGAWVAAPAGGQSPPEPDDAAVPPAAAFSWQFGQTKGSDPQEGSEHPDGEGGLEIGAPDLELDGAQSTPAPRQASDALVLSDLATGAAPAETLDAAFAFRNPSGAPVPVAATMPQADRWARSVFSSEASLRTPLAPGQEMFGWELADGLTLSGVGSARVITERDRGVVLSAEAGIRLTPRAGFHVGYELLQASAGPAEQGLGGESVFARFQLRF